MCVRAREVKQSCCYVYAGIAYITKKKKSHFLPKYEFEYEYVEWGVGGRGGEGGSPFV